MSTGTLISIIVGFIGLVLAIFFYMNDSLNNRIEKAVNDSDFIKKVADEIRLPFLIFDRDGVFQAESGGAIEYIEKIAQYQSDGQNRSFDGFVVYTKIFLKNAPLLQGINSDYRFTPAKRINTKDWLYRIPKTVGVTVLDGGYDEEPAELFKLEIIR